MTATFLLFTWAVLSTAEVDSANATVSDTDDAYDLASFDYTAHALTAIAGAVAHQKASTQAVVGYVDKLAFQAGTPIINKYVDKAKKRLKQLKKSRKGIEKMDKKMKRELQKRLNLFEKLRGFFSASMEDGTADHDKVGRVMDSTGKLQKETEAIHFAKIKADVEKRKEEIQSKLSEVNQENSEQASGIESTLREAQNEQAGYLKEMQNNLKQQWASIGDKLKTQGASLRSAKSGEQKISRSVNRLLNRLFKDLKRETKDRQRSLGLVFAKERRAMDKIRRGGEKGMQKIQKAGDKEKRQYDKETANEFKSMQSDLKRGMNDAAKADKQFQREIGKELEGQAKAVEMSEAQVDRMARKFMESQNSAREEIASGQEKMSGLKRTVEGKFQAQAQGQQESINAAQGGMAAYYEKVAQKMQSKGDKDQTKFQEDLEKTLGKEDEELSKTSDEGANAVEKLLEGAEKVDNNLQNAERGAEGTSKDITSLQGDTEEKFENVQKLMEKRQEETAAAIDAALSVIPGLVAKVMKSGQDYKGDIAQMLGDLESELRSALSRSTKEFDTRYDKDLDMMKGKTDNMMSENDEGLEKVKEGLNSMKMEIQRLKEQKIPALGANIMTESKTALDKMETEKEALSMTATEMSQRMTDKVKEEIEAHKTNVEGIEAHAMDVEKSNKAAVASTKQKVEEDITKMTAEAEKAVSGLTQGADDAAGQLTTEENAFRATTDQVTEKRQALENKQKELTDEVNKIVDTTRKTMDTDRQSILSTMDLQTSPVAVQAEADSKTLATTTQEKLNELRAKAQGGFKTTKEQLDHLKADSDSKLGSFRGAMNKIKTEFTTEELAATKAADVLSRQVQEDKEQAARVKQQRDRELKHLTEAQMQAQASMEDAIKSAMGDATGMLDGKERASKRDVNGALRNLNAFAADMASHSQAELRNVDTYSKYQGSRLSKDEAHLQSDLHRYLNGVQATQNYLTKDMSDTGARVEYESVSQKKSVEGAARSENSEFGKELTVAERLVQTLDEVKTAMANALHNDASQWADHKASAIYHIDEVSRDVVMNANSIINTLEEAKKQSSGAVGAIKNAKEQLQAQLEDAYNSTKGKLENVEKVLEEEKTLLKQNTDNLRDLIEHSLDHIGTAIDSSVGKMHENFQEAHRDLDDIELKQMKFEAQIKKASVAETVHDQKSVDKLKESVEMLELMESQLSMWAHGWQKHDLAWKRLVGSKLKELGIEVGDEQVRILQQAADAYQGIKKSQGKIVGGIEEEMAKQRGKVNDELAAVMARTDAKVAKILSSKHLSDDEKEAAIKKIQDQSAAEVARLMAQHKNMEANQMVLQRNIAKYGNMVDDALEATKRARGEGILTSKAQEFYRKMGDVSTKLEHLKSHGLGFGEEESTNGMYSFLQLLSRSHSKEAVHQANMRMQEEDNQLADTDKELEAKIDALKVLVAKHEQMGE